MTSPNHLPRLSPPRALIGIIGFACAGSLVAAFTGSAAHPQLQYLDTLAVAGAVAAVIWRSITVRTDRLAWAMLGAAGTCWATADIVYAVFFAGLDAPPAPSVADVLWLAYYPFAIAGISVLVHGRLARVPGAYWLDAALGMAAAGAVAATVTADLVAAAGGGPNRLATLVNVGYPVGDFLTLLLVVGAMLGCRAWRSATWMLLATSLALGVMSDTAYLVGLSDTSMLGRVLALGLPFSALLLAMSAWRPVAQTTAVETRQRRWTVLTITAFFGLVALVLLVIDHAHRLPGSAIVLSSVAIGLLIVRLALVFRENFALVDVKHVEAMTDALTGLGNRRALQTDLGRSAAGTGEPAILGLFDLNGFKGYNDLFGHPSGDLLLSRLGGRLTEAASRLGGTAYRLGGDEFCVIVPLRGASSTEIITRSTAALREYGDGFSVEAAWGMAEIPCPGGSEAALRTADQRMYAQKNGTRPTVAQQTVDVLMAALRERTPQLGDHVDGVAEMAVAIAEKLGFTPQDVQHVHLAAELHDIGKIAIPDEILLKPGPLNAEEWRFMRRHTLIGERILLAARDLREVSPLVRSSHERWDGTGYPDGLRADEIPLGARIITVCDAFDAMLARRPYSDPMSTEESLEEVRRCSGTQFDPGVVAAFGAVMQERREVLASV